MQSKTFVPAAGERLCEVAAVRLAAGDDRGSLEAASAACHADPLRPEAHYVYGQAWSALGDHRAAERAFAEAVRLAPRWADAWVNYGVARYRQGAIEDAKSAMKRALIASPYHAAAASNLSAFLRISGEIEKAEATLSAQIARDPLDIGARLNMAATLLLEERAEEALGILDPSVAPVQNDQAARHWRLQRSLALLQLNRPAEADAELAALEAAGSIPPEVAPLWRWRRVLLARARGDMPAAAAEATAMEAALASMGPSATPEHAIMARYDLAKFWSMADQPARAFAHWSEAHKLLGRIQPFSRESHRAFVDASIAGFTGERFRAGPRARNADPTPIFIVGMPRSGTTLAERILAAHRNVHGAGERLELGRLFGRLAGAREDGAAIPRLLALPVERLNAEADAYLRDLRALASGKGRVVDKMPGNFNFLGLVGLLLPGAKIIHCVRDPRDVGLSIFTFRFHGDHGYAHDLADLGWYIGEHDRLMRHWAGHLPNPILTLRLSDWVADFDSTLARVLDFCGLPHDPNCVRFHESESRVRTVSRAQVRRPVNADGLGRWIAYAEPLAPLIAELERNGSLEGWR